jgi:flagellin-specific chaperone FliS
MSFKKANVIANEKETENVADIKKLAKSLKEKSFSVMNYDFLDEKFPIKFIDKIVTVLPSMNYDFEVSLTKLYENFFNKIFKLNVKTVSVAVTKSMDILPAIKGKYDVEMKLSTQRFNLFKLKIK